jgi:uncharacterized protein (TIGR03067 family)
MQTSMLMTVLALSAPALKDAPKPKASDIQGVWSADRITAYGQPVTGVWQQIFNPDGSVRRRLGEEQEFATYGTYSVNTKSRPMTIDTDADPGQPGSIKTHGIWKVQGDTLTICVSNTEAPRPMSFASETGSANILIVFKRVKE